MIMMSIPNDVRRPSRGRGSNGAIVILAAVLGTRSAVEENVDGGGTEMRCSWRCDMTEVATELEWLVAGLRVGESGGVPKNTWVDAGCLSVDSCFSSAMLLPRLSRPYTQRNCFLKLNCIILFISSINDNLYI